MTSFRRNNPQEAEGDSALGPMLGLRRPRFETLHEVLAPWLELQPQGGELFVFVNVTSVLRHLFSEFSVAKLSRGELNRHPRLLAAELVNIASHYRHYAQRFYGLSSTVLLYHSTKKCAAKLAVDEGYKASVYAKRMEAGATGEYELLRRYVEFNLGVAKPLFERIPHMHLVDTGEIDPEAWPMALMLEGRVTGPALFLSSYAADLQYALGSPADAGMGHQSAVLHANGDHSRLTDRAGLVAESLRSSKTGAELAVQLAPEHYLYMLALAGEEDLGVRGVQKTGLAKAAKLIAKAVSAGRLPPDAVSLQALLEDGQIPEGTAPDVERAWRLLVHHDYAATVEPALLSLADAQLVNRSGLGELEKANAQFFDGVLNIEMAFSGETGY